MKTCTYCGKKYPDDATVCAVDAEPLIRLDESKASTRTDPPPIGVVIAESSNPQRATSEHSTVLNEAAAMENSAAHSIVECPHCGRKVIFITTFCPSCQKSRLDGGFSPSYVMAAEASRISVHKRPAAVTAIASFLITVSLISILGATYSAFVLQGSGLGLLIGVQALLSLAFLSWGCGFLLGSNVARMSYLWIVPLLALFNIVYLGRVSPQTIFGLLLYVIFAVVLNQRNAVRFFTGVDKTSP